MNPSSTVKLICFSLLKIKLIALKARKFFLFEQNNCASSTIVSKRNVLNLKGQLMSSFNVFNPIIFYDKTSIFILVNSLF